ncbi:MAG: NADH-quinone oxidoreductase subunit L [Clostridiales Family XIII bacterium]|nr:NADH-quinone oxidoreductase subunit L [Clostridiales Family XIII bacterium]
MFSLILLPAVVAVALLLVKGDQARGVLAIAGSILIGALSIFLTVRFFTSGSMTFNLNENHEELAEFIGYAMMAIEIILAVVIFALGIKHKKYLASLLAALQTPLMVWFEFSTGKNIEVENALYYDQLSIIMALIIGIIGTLICVYALGYMKDFQHHHHDEADRRPWFFFLLFLFLAAMYGIVFSNNLVWLYFFWEITTLCSFFLIGFTKTKEATNNSFRALIMNLFGGLAFVLAIILVGRNGVLELSGLLQMAAYSPQIVTPPLILLVFAGLTKAAQMPFNSWLLGAMVAPTPTSALLHSSTMVKAGVFLILKLAPAFMMTNSSLVSAGTLAMMVGGITFLMASCAAISQSNAKRVLAYSTVANLGLIIVCAGTGMPGGIWAATMLIIFHAVTKSLLFLCVGTAEHNIGSRDIEDMDGLFSRMPRLALFMIVGISAMFLAPFGMLVSKWAALESLIYSSNPLVLLMVVFGSSVTVFYWGKWLGKMLAIVAKRENIQHNVHKEEWSSLGSLVALVIAACITFPAFSKRLVEPFIISVYGGLLTEENLQNFLLGSENLYIMMIMTAVILLLPMLFLGKSNKRIMPIYLAGAGLNDNLKFMGSMQKETEFSLRNWYMEGYFAEKRMNLIGIIATVLVMVYIFSSVAAVVFRGGV